jgi:tRNA uridine 5-carboxymethylaminomethyl modification enzyme
MIDDLITRGVTEPYRMFTSRAEYRLSLRADNADQRLTQKGMDWGLVGKLRQEAYKTKLEKLNKANGLFNRLTLTPSEARKYGLKLNFDGQRRNAYELLSYPDIEFEQLAAIWPELHTLEAPIADQIQIEAKYAVYLDRQQAAIMACEREEQALIPQDLTYEDFPGLSSELRDKLSRARPQNIGQASRIEGMTPAALSLLLLHIKRSRDERAA